MMTTVEDLLACGNTWSRDELSRATGLDDRAVRLEIEQMRRNGIPVLALPSGGYRLAKNDEEKAAVLKAYKKRALTMLKTCSLMAKNFQLDGQISLSELTEALEVSA